MLPEEALVSAIAAAVVEHGSVIADPEDDVAGRLSDGGGDRRDQRLLW